MAELLSSMSAELASTIADLLPGFHRLFRDLAVPSSVGSYVREAAVLELLHDVATHYSSRGTVLAVIRAVLVLEAGRGLSLQGLVAVFCKLATEIFEPFDASFPTHSDKMRVLLYFADPAQKYFSHSPPTLPGAARPALLPRPKTSGRLPASTTPRMAAAAASVTPARISWEGAVQQLDALLHSLACVGAATAADAPASPSPRAHGSPRAMVSDASSDFGVRRSWSAPLSESGYVPPTAPRASCSAI